MATPVDEEEENELLITKVVEYVQPRMAKELLCKFPDNSAFDFDYTQSSIWSPLVPRAQRPMDFDLDLNFDFMEPRKILFGMGLESKKSGFEKLTSNIKKRIAEAAFDMNLGLAMRKKKKIKGSAAELPSPNPCSKGWSKVLRAASKQFKRKKKRDASAHVKISS